MFDFFRRHTRVLQFVLVLLIVPLVRVLRHPGLQRHVERRAQTVATVDGRKISQMELDNSLRERVERARRQMPGIDAEAVRHAGDAAHGARRA